MKVWIALCLLGVGLSGNAAAASATVSLSENSALLKYSLKVGGQSFGVSEAGLGVVFNSKQGYLFDADFHVVDEAGASLPGLKIGVGGKFYAGMKEKHQLSAIGVGGFFRYSIPGLVRLHLGADGYYAPTIVSFIDSERFYEWAGLIGYEILPQASVYIEYREFQSKARNIDGNIAVDAGARFGVLISF